MDNFIYLITSPVYILLGICKIGLTTLPIERLPNLLTGYPPGIGKGLYYLKLWRVSIRPGMSLERIERNLHLEFSSYNMSTPSGKCDLFDMTGDNGGTEWFNFKNPDMLDQVKEHVGKLEFILEEIAADDTSLHRADRNIIQDTFPNMNFIDDDDIRLQELNKIQKPVIESIVNFLHDPTKVGGYVVAPCGIGKTVMGCKALRLSALNKVLIVVPDKTIAEQWKDALDKHGKFLSSEISIAVSKGDTKIRDACCKFSEARRIFMIVTYNSTAKMIPLLNNCELVIFDEFHRAVGEYGDEKGAGSTRALTKETVDRKIKTLGLTATPKKYAEGSYVFENFRSEAEGNIVTTEDIGQCISSVSLRSAIKKGILPDYRIAVVEGDDANDNKYRLLAESFNSKKSVKDYDTNMYIDKFIINHLLVYTKEHSHAIIAGDVIRTFLGDEVKIIITLEREELAANLAKFSSSSRAILISCDLLKVGIDIPIADSVAIMFNTKSIISAVQRILRAGRYHPGKEVFHILIVLDPSTSGASQNFDTLETIFTSLAENDRALFGEIEWLGGDSGTNGKIQNGNPEILNIYSSVGRAYTTIFASDLKAINDCFARIKKKITKDYTTKVLPAILSFCKKMNITNIEKYNKIRLEYDMPPSSGIDIGADTWFLKLNGVRNRDGELKPKRELIKLKDFELLLRMKQLRTLNDYKTALPLLRSENASYIPEVDEIADGFFGSDKEHKNLIDILGRATGSANAIRRHRLIK